MSALAGVFAQDTHESPKAAPPNDVLSEESGKASTEASSNENHPLSEAGPTYVIHAEDMLHVAVWKEPELTLTLPVRSDGMISLPLVNDVPAAGLTPMQLAGVLTEKLRKYLEAPRVTVVVTQIRTQRVYALGEVSHTGPISLLPDMTILQALATAGLTPFANTKGIYLLRMDKGRQQKIAFNYRQVIKGGDPSQNITLKPGDTIVVP
jgi:polysaccharide export outer membrane protein